MTKMSFFDKNKLRYDCQSFEATLWQKRQRNIFAECPASGCVPLTCVLLLLEVGVIHKMADRHHTTSTSEMGDNDQRGVYR